MKVGALLFVTTLLLAGGARTAEAALTSSERAQIRDYVAAARAENAPRVRSLVARTDLTSGESFAALEEAVAPVPFTEPRGTFLRELAFGASSAASRPLLVRAVTRALLARADVVYQRYVGGLDHEPRAVEELVSIYGFVDGAIANAGQPTLAAHDAAAGIPPAAYEDCSKELRAHVEKNARWLKGEGAVPESVGRVRAAAQVALLDMLPDGLTRRVDAADRLGLAGARRRILTEWGILLQDTGKLDDARSEKIRQALARLPGARHDLELVYAGEDRGPLRARGAVVFVSGATVGQTNPFGDELTPTRIDAGVSAVVGDLAVLAVKRALDTRGELKLQAERDAASTRGEPGRMLGKPPAPSVEHVVGAAAQLLALDAPRAVDLAFVRVIGGRPESAALLSDAVGALAATATPAAAKPGAPDRSSGVSLELGSAAGTTTMSAIRLAPSGAAVGFTLDGHAWAISRGAPGGAVTGVTRDGQSVTVAHLPTAQTPLREGSSWSEGGYAFTKLRGAPRVGMAPLAGKGGGVTVKLVGAGAKGYDAITTSAPGDDLVIEGELSVRGAPGGLAFRAAKGRDAVRGAMLVITPGGRAAIVTSDDAGAEALLAAPISPPPTMPVHVKISVKGLKVEAVIGTTTLTGTLPPTLAKGEVGLVAKRGAGVDMVGLSVKKN
jgi:hypothetical protein